MKWTKLDSPGQWYFREALYDMLKTVPGEGFLDVGCGSGGTSLELLKRGYWGLGLDYSQEAVRRAVIACRSYIDKHQYMVIPEEASYWVRRKVQVPIILALFILEHQPDDLSFLETLKTVTKPNGWIVCAVPGRKDKWFIDDEIAGHYRRYDKEDLEKLMWSVGLKNVEVWSVATYIHNILSLPGINKLWTKDGRYNRLNLDQEERTKVSGISEIKMKTVYPWWFKYLLNRVTLWPLFMVQRLWYGSDKGPIMLGKGQVV